MIKIASAPFDISALESDYSPRSVEWQLLEQMNASAYTYEYNSLEELRFELKMRREIVNAANALHKSGLDFAGFHDVKRNPEYWDISSNGGLELKAGAIPSEAINDIFENGNKYATECATAMMIVYYKALLETFGADKFNKQFNSIYLMNWNVREPLLEGVGTPRKFPDILLGDRGYFRNPQVDPTTPEWQGENVIILPDNLYYGHGIGLTTADKIIKSLNSNRKSGATISAYFMDEVSRPNFKKLYSAYKSLSAEGTQTRAASTGPLVWKPFPKPITRA